MKLQLPFTANIIAIACIYITNFSLGQSFPLNTSNPHNTFGAPVRENGAIQIPTAQIYEPLGEVPDLSQNIQSTPNTAAASSSSNFASNFATYPQDIQNIVRACNGDLHKIYDLIRNNVEFQPYFGFRKSPEFTWQSRRGNDADQAFLLVECLRAAGFTAEFQYGVVVLSDIEALDWFGADNIASLGVITGSSGYSAGVDTGIYATEQIWCNVTVDNVKYRLAPAYKTYEDIVGIDLATAMNYSQSGLLTAAGGTETSTYVQGVSETGVNTYLANRAMDLVTELQANYPTAEMDEIIGGRRILETNLAADFSNGFYSAGAFVSGGFDTFTFDNPYSDYGFNGTVYRFFAVMNVAVGEVNAAGNAFIAAPFVSYTVPTGILTGKKIAVTFDSMNQNAAELRIDDQIVSSEGGIPTSNPIGIGYLFDYPYDRSVGNTYDEIRIRPIQRTGYYVYTYDPGGVGEATIARRRQEIANGHARDNLTTTDPEVATEALFQLGLNWARQYDLVSNIITEHRRFVPILHHTMAFVKQESGFSVDIPSTQVNASRDDTTTFRPGNTRSLTIFGSAMEHGVIEQNQPSFGAVSTIRYVWENNAAGGKTFLATSANYSTIQSDPDFINGWSSTFRDIIFLSDLSFGLDLVIPQSGAITLGSLTGNGYFQFADNQIGAIINPGALKGGFAIEPGFIDFSLNPFPLDPTPGPDSLENPLSFEPIDMLTGAYVYDGTEMSISGEGVRGLKFMRHYSSLASGLNSGMGKGWSHNYQSSIIEHSDIDAALGEATPVHAASLIAATWAVSDLVDLETSAKAWVVSSIASFWGLEEIKGNAVTVKMGRKNLPFTKLADGSFVPPAGMTSILTQDSGTGNYSLEERFDIVADFNADNRLASIMDADGNQMTYSYFTSGANQGKLQTVTDHYNRTLTFTYTNDLLSQVADSTGRDVDFAYTGELLTGVTDPENHTATYAYDSDDRIQSVFNKKGEKIAENTYDEFGQVCFQAAEDDAEQEWEYAFTGALNVEINPDREFLSYTFDKKGRTTAVTNGASNKTQMSHDGQNQLVLLTDPRGNITRFEYDERNNLRFTYDARNGASGTTYKIEQQYDAEDRLFKLIDEEGNETVYTYTTEHQLETVTDPLLREISYTYFTSGPHDGLIETITTPGATAGTMHVTTNAYDANGYPNSITRPDTSVVTQTYNARGDLTFAEVTVTGETNTYPVTNTYDLNRRPLTTRDAFNFGVTITYDAVGNVIATTDRFGNESTITYSPLSRVEAATASNNETISYQYDDSGRRDQIIDPLNQISTIEYDAAGRLEVASNPLSQSVIQTYDATGNRTGLTNSRSKFYQFNFNANNLRTSLTTPLNRVFNYTYDDRRLLRTFEEPSMQTVTYSHYGDGLLEQTVDPTGAIDFAYDAKGRLKTVTEGSDVITRAYDSLDRVVSFTDSQGSTIGYEYYGAGYLAKLTYPGSKGDVDYEYDDAGRLTKVTDWANRETEFFYDGNSRLMEMRLPNGTKREYFYDAAGRVERQTDTHIASGIVFLDQQYKFDALNRIVEEIVTPEPALYSITPVIMTYDDDDRINSWQSGVMNITPAFDADGNMTTGILSSASETFAYDSRNRLTQVGVTTYAYDAENRRISKIESGATTTFVHDPHAPLSVLLQKVTSNISTYYVYAGGQLLYEETNGQITVYHFDSRGSTLALTDASGAMKNRITYGAYGEIVATTTAPTTPFLYNGAYGVQTDLNGLLNMRARYYSTEIRRFINSDPIGFGGGMNLYSFTGGNPISALDPNGLSTVRIATRDGEGNVSVSTLIDPTIDNFRATIAGTEDGSIVAMEILGHGNKDAMIVEPGGATGDGLVNIGRNDGVVYSDTAESFSDSIEPKLAPNACISLGGCNTANNRKNILGSEDNVSKRLSEDLPGVAVTGYRGFAFGNEISNPFNRDQYIRIGRENYSEGAIRTYIDGENLGRRPEFLFNNAIERAQK